MRIILTALMLLLVCACTGEPISPTIDTPTLDLVGKACANGNADACKAYGAVAGAR